MPVRLPIAAGKARLEVEWAGVGLVLGRGYCDRRPDRSRLRGKFVEIGVVLRCSLSKACKDLIRHWHRVLLPLPEKWQQGLRSSVQPTRHWIECLLSTDYTRNYDLEHSPTYYQRLDRHKDGCRTKMVGRGRHTHSMQSYMGAADVQYNIFST